MIEAFSKLDAHTQQGIIFAVGWITFFALIVIPCSIYSLVELHYNHQQKIEQIRNKTYVPPNKPINQ